MVPSSVALSAADGCPFGRRQPERPMSTSSRANAAMEWRPITRDDAVGRTEHARAA